MASAALCQRVKHLCVRRGFWKRSWNAPLLPTQFASTTVDSAANMRDFYNTPSFALRSMVMVTKTSTAEQSLREENDPSDDALPSTLSNEGNKTVDDSMVFVTDSCWRRIHQVVASKRQHQQQQEQQPDFGNNLFLRVFVDAGGCSGFTYQFEMDQDANLDDREDVIFTEQQQQQSNLSPANNALQQQPARVVIDRGSLKLIHGSKIDYVEEMIKSSFEVRENPQSESACGCGSSFALKNFSSNPALD